VLDSTKALFFGGSHKATVSHDACGGIAVVSIDAQDDAHGCKKMDETKMNVEPAFRQAAAHGRLPDSQQDPELLHFALSLAATLSVWRGKP
jgi:hypothetical protein